MATLPRSFVPDKPVVPKSFVPDEPEVSAADEDIAPDTQEQDFGPNRVTRNSKGQQVYFDGTIWKDAFTGKQAEGPQQQAATIPGMEKLGALPGVPAPRVSMSQVDMNGLPIDEHFVMAGAETEPKMTPVTEGIGRMAQGAKKFAMAAPGAPVAQTSGPVPIKRADTRQLAAGATDVIEGGFQAASPLIGPGLVEAPAATLATLGLAGGAGYGVQRGLEATGAPKEYAGLGGAVAAVLAGGATGKKVLAKLYEAAGSPEVKIGGKFEEPKPFSKMTDDELVAHANSIERDPPKNYNWQKEQIVQEAAKRQAERGMAAPEEAPKPPDSFVPDESPIQGGPLTRVRKVRMPKSFVPDTPPEAVAPPEASVVPIETPTSREEVQPVVAPPVQEKAVQISRSASPEAAPSLAAAPPSGGLPKTQEIVATPEQKQPWQMTRREWLDSYPERTRAAVRVEVDRNVAKLNEQIRAGLDAIAADPQNPANGAIKSGVEAAQQKVAAEMGRLAAPIQSPEETWSPEQIRWHHVEGALREGKPVPPEALADYPELAPAPAPVEAKPPDGGAQPTPKEPTVTLTPFQKMQMDVAGKQMVTPDPAAVAASRRELAAAMNPAQQLKAAAAKNVLKAAEKKAKNAKALQPKSRYTPAEEEPDETALQSRRVPKQGGAGNNLPTKKPQEPAGEAPLQSRPALRLPDRIPASGIILPGGEVHTISGATHEGMAGSKGYKFGDFLKAGGVRYRYNGSDVAMELHPSGIPNAIEFLDTVRPEGRLDVDVSGAEYSGRAPVGALSLNRGGGNRYYGWEDAIHDLRKLRTGKSESPAQQSSAAPLQSKPIEGPAFRPGMSRSAKVTESQVIPARAGREKYPVLHVNAQAMNVLHEAAGMEDGHEIPGVTFTTPQAEELMRTINTELRKARLRNKPAEIAKWEEIRSAIEQNRAQAKGRPLIAVQNGTDITPEEYATALQEELDHASQLEATGDIYAHHLGPEGTKSFLGSAEGSRAANALRRTYPDVSDSQAVMEIGVRLMRPGRFAELGLSPEEARNLRDAYVNALISRHGVERTVRISQKISAAKDREGRVNYGHAGKTTLDARRSGGSERTKTPAPREDGGGSGVRKGGGGSGEGLPPVRDGEGPLQQRKDEGPEFRKKPSAFRVATDFFKPVETRIAQEGPAGKQLKRHLVRAEDVGEVQAGKRVVALRDSGLQDLSREDRQNLVDSLQGFAQPQNAAVQKAFDGIRKVTDEIAAEATTAGVQSKQARTIRPEDPIPPTAKLTQTQKDLRAAGKRIFVQYKRPFQARSNFYPHVIPPPDELRSGDIRRDVADNMVRNGVAANGDEARQMIDEYRKFIDTGERSKKLEAHLVESGQARDANEAHTLLGILRRRVIKRQGSLEYSRQVDLPFYDPDPARVMPKFVTATSLRLAQIREFGQNDEVVNRLIRIIDQTSGNPGFAKMAVDKILAKVNEADTGTARISRAARAFNGFKLGLSFIPNATQGALNSLLKSDLPSTLAGAKGLMTKEGRRFAMQSGASLEGVVNEMLRSVGADNSALGTFLKATGFAQTEQANRIWAANAGYAYAKRMLDVLKRNPQDGRARKVLTELGLKPDVLLKLGKIDGDAALIAAKKFSDITQFRGGIKDLPYFAASPLGKVIFQFKSFVYGQTRLVYDELVDELNAAYKAGRAGNAGEAAGRFGRGMRTLLLLATVFPLAGEVISDLRTWMKGGERKTSGIKRWLEDIGQAGSLGVIYDMLDAGGWGKGVEFFAGPTLGEAGQVVNIAGGDKKARNAAKWIVKHVPFLGPLFYSRVFPPKEAQSPALKKLTGGSKLRRPKLRTKL